MDTENSLVSSRVLLTTGIIISTLLLCVVASDFLTFKPAGTSPTQQSIAQRQQNRFAEFYPGSVPAPASTPIAPIRLAGSAQNVIPVTAARSVSVTSQASAVTAAQSSPAITAISATTNGTQEQFYTPEIGAASESGSAESSVKQIPVNVTINNSDLAPQLASLNARLDELSKQLAEKSNEARTERVFEYRIEDEESVKETHQCRKSSQQSNVAESPAAVSQLLQSVPTAPQIPVQISVTAPAPQPAQAPQIIVVTPQAYPWGMPPSAAAPVTPLTMSLESQSAATAPPARATEPPPVSRTEPRITKAENQPRENSGTTNLFPLNLQMSLNLSPAANSPVANSEPEFMAKPTPTELKAPSRDETGASKSSTSLEIFEDTFADDSARPGSAKTAPSTVKQVSIEPTPASDPETASTVAKAVKDDVTPELFMPFEPIEPKPASETASVQTPAKPEVPVHAPQPKETAVAMIRNAAVSEKTTEDPVPVLEPIFAPTIEPVSASKSSETEAFVPEPEPSEPDAPSNGPRVAPAPEPDPMFLTPSANSAWPPQPLMTVPATEFEPQPTNAMPPVDQQASPSTGPLSAPPVSETVVPEAWPGDSPVFDSGPTLTRRPAPEKSTKRSRFASVRDAFSEAGEEVRERFDNLPRPSFEVPNWIENFGSDSASKPEAPAKQTPAAGCQNSGSQSSAGPRRFHDAQNATGKPGQAMLQGNRSAVARREPSRTTGLPTGSPWPATVPQTAMRAPSRQPTYMSTPPGVQPSRVMTFNGTAIPRPSMSVPQFATPDWIEDPSLQWPAPPVSQTAHRISSALRFAGQPKVVR